MIDPITGGGGVERTFQMSKYLVHSNQECTLLATNLRASTKRIKALSGVKVVLLNCLFARFYIPSFSYAQIKQIVASCDIIHMMQHWTALNAIVYIIARQLNKPYVICPAGSLPQLGRSKVIKNIYNLIIGNRIIRHASGHIAISPDEIVQFAKYSIHPKQVSLIPNGINVENLCFQGDNDFKKKYGVGAGKFILFMGRLNAIKGPDLLLDAFIQIHEKLPNYHLVFGGPDEGLLQELKNKVLLHNLDYRIHFLGFLSGNDKSKAYDAADFLAIPSRQEAMSIVVLEAGVTATPVLITDQCGMNIIEKIKGGKVVPATRDGLQQGILDMTNSPTNLLKMGNNLKGYTYENFRWDSIIKKFLALYESILKNKNIILSETD